MQLSVVYHKRTILFDFMCWRYTAVASNWKHTDLTLNTRIHSAVNCFRFWNGNRRRTRSSSLAALCFHHKFWGTRIVTCRPGSKPMVSTSGHHLYDPGRKQALDALKTKVPERSEKVPCIKSQQFGLSQSPCLSTREDVQNLRYGAWKHRYASLQIWKKIDLWKGSLRC